MGYKIDKIFQRFCIGNKYYYIKYYIKLKGFVLYRIKISYYINKKKDYFFREKNVREYSL